MRRLLPSVAGLLALAASAAAQSGAPTDVKLAIGPDRAVVRELREVNFTSAVQEVAFDGIPPQADLSTLQIGGERQGVRLLSARRAQPARSDPEGPVAWRPASAPAVDPGIGPVLAVLETTRVRARPVELVYQIDGLSWRAEYEATVRGDVANHLEPLALDLQCRVWISNATPRAFAGAELLLSGGTGAFAAPEEAPGFLMLDDASPLADRWRVPPPRAAVPHAYPLPGLVNVPAGGAVSARFAQTRRQPADRRYLADGALLDRTTRQAWQPLDRHLVLPNDAAHGLGADLPPGPALIYLGGARGALHQRAAIPHTPRGGDLHINLGPTRGVTARREIGARKNQAAGFHEQTVVISIANALPSAVKVDVLERPPAPLAWDIVRSSRPYERSAGRLAYALQLEARRDAEITYTIRLSEPVW